MDQYIVGMIKKSVKRLKNVQVNVYQLFHFFNNSQTESVIYRQCSILLSKMSSDSFSNFYK